MKSVIRMTATKLIVDGVDQGDLDRKVLGAAIKAKLGMKG